MDRKLSEKAQIERLIQLSANSRARLESEAIRIKQRFDIPAKIRGSLNEHPTSWLLGSLASGLVGSLLISRRPKTSSKPQRRGMIGVMLGLAVTAARPMAKVWVSNQFAKWLRHASTHMPSARSLQ